MLLIVEVHKRRLTDLTCTCTLAHSQMPAQFETDFVGAVFRLGLKCSSPKVLE